VHGVWTVEQVRAAETALMATLPEGVLMQRAAHAVALHCGDLLGSVYGASVVLLVGSGSNGGDALHAGAKCNNSRADLMPKDHRLLQANGAETAVMIIM